MLAILSYNQKVWAMRFRPLIKQMNLHQCRNAFQNGAMTHSCYKFTKVLSTQYFCHVQFHHLISNLMIAIWLQRFLYTNFLNYVKHSYWEGFGWYFSDWTRVRKKNTKGLSSKIFLVSKMFLKKQKRQKHNPVFRS